MAAVPRRSQELAQSPRLETGHGYDVPAACLRGPFSVSRFRYR
jgi:hypothetical protein